MFKGTHKHPEWKRLLDEVTTRVTENPDKRLFTYEELESMAGIDIRSIRGRQQFDRFAQESEKILSLSWANVMNVGYRIIEAHEHATYGVKRVQRARKQLKRGKNTVDCTPLEKLNDAQKTATLAMQSFIRTLGEYVRKETRKAIKTAHAIENERLLVDKTIEHFMPKNEDTPKH